ncbi:signal recognition particle 14 kDa protein-like [Globicephala melas]|uniref:signal recognition particle 14 kDa protein-like n=1 Tax=Globicephala melas TaxID=9731 RepID=UPI00293D40EF|nr:signal recognition particle 14 kDa protein-like [Globicephala melas]
MVLLESEQFLTELTRLFQKCRLSGSVFITLKNCKQLWMQQGRKGAGRPSDAPARVPSDWEPQAESVCRASPPSRNFLHLMMVELNPFQGRVLWRALSPQTTSVC